MPQRFYSQGKKPVVTMWAKSAPSVVFRELSMIHPQFPLGISQRTFIILSLCKNGNKVTLWMSL
jgi:hypothetical protein